MSKAILISGLAAITVAIIVAAILIVQAINEPRVITPVQQQSTSLCDDPSSLLCNA